MKKGTKLANRNVSQKEKSDELPPPVIDYIDLPDKEKEFAFEYAEMNIPDLLQSKAEFYEVAQIMKEAFDEEFGACYHVCVGKDFGSYFSYEVNKCIQFWIGEFCFLIYKHG